MRILITAFEPFGGEKNNPTIEVVEALQGLEEVDIKKLPVTFSCFEEVTKIPELNMYDYILHLGQAGGRSKITLGQVGINRMDARIPDNNGFQPKGEAILENGGDGIFTTLPIRELVTSLQHKGFPVSISYTAGTYVCNYIMYSSLHHFKGSKTKVGFIHIPYSPSQVVYKEAPSMDTKIVIDAVKATVELLRENAFSSSKGSFGETH